MRLRWFLTMTAILVAAVGITVAVSDRLDAGGDGGDQLIGGADGTVAPGASSSSTSTSAPAGPVGRLQVTGTVTAVHLEDAVLDPRDVPTPLTVVSDRGFGNGAEITGVQVDGAAVSIVWDGGRPFVLSSGGALVLDPLTVDLAPEGLRLALSSSVHLFRPGTYQLDTPVAVGSRGVANARDAVTFTATGESTFEPRGDAALFLAPTGPRRLLGPGTVHLEGALEITDAAGTRAATTLDAAVGAFDITLTPLAAGWTITATLQGETTTA